MLDLCVYLDEHNIIHYQGYTKPTDAKRYLNPHSFHPKFVFNSIPFSQLLRTLRNNSKEETKIDGIEQSLKDFEKSGYNKKELIKWKEKAIEKQRSVDHSSINDQKENTLIFPVHYFDGITEFKNMVNSLKNEITDLIGENKVMFAMKKKSSVGNMLVRNKQLSLQRHLFKNQMCNSRGCLQCPLNNTRTRFVINGKTVTVPQHLNCKSTNVIYMWICRLCGEKETYFGRTIQETHSRTTGHRSCFNDEKWDKSALSMHAQDVHQMNFSLDSFSISIVAKVSPQHIRRAEFKYIDKYNTRSRGLNRYKC